MYLLKLAGRMTRAAVAVPLGDIDRALALSAATRYIDGWADAFAAMRPAPEEMS